MPPPAAKLDVNKAGVKRLTQLSLETRLDFPVV